MGATVVAGNEELYAASKCPSGVYLSKVDEHGAFAQAGIEADSLLVSVNDFELDQFGMAKNKEFAQDTALFSDLMFMDSDITKPATVTTCKCGETMTHQVTHDWNKKMLGPIEDEPQPSLVRHKFARFANVTFQQLDKELAKKFILEGQRLDLVPYVMGDDKKPAVVITSTDGLAVEQGGQALKTGSIVTHLNGKPIETMNDFAEAFKPTAKDECSDSSSEKTFASKDQDSTGKMSWLESCKPSGDEPWVLKTADGEVFATAYASELGYAANTMPENQYTTLMEDAMNCEGIKPGQKQQTQNAFVEQTQVLPIEARKTARGYNPDWTKTRVGGARQI